MLTVRLWDTWTVVLLYRRGKKVVHRLIKELLCNIARKTRKCKMLSVTACIPKNFYRKQVEEKERPNEGLWCRSCVQLLNRRTALTILCPSVFSGVPTVATLLFSLLIFVLRCMGKCRIKLEKQQWRLQLTKQGCVLWKGKKHPGWHEAWLNCKGLWEWEQGVCRWSSGR